MVIGYKFVSILIVAPCKRFKIWPNIFCAFSTIFSGGGSIRVAKRRRSALFETDLETVKKNLTEGQFTVKDNVGHGNGAFWSAYQNILTNDGTCTNYVRCRFCSKVNKYDTKKNGTRQLSEHARICTRKPETVVSYIYKDVKVTAEEKKSLSNSAAIYCSMDIRPFYSIECDGFVKFLADFSKIPAKYGCLTEKSVREILPSRQTVL